MVFAVMYRVVTSANPVEVLNFSGFYIRNCKNCVYSCEDHSLCDFISAVPYMIDSSIISSLGNYSQALTDIYLNHSIVQQGKLQVNNFQPLPKQ